MRAALRFVTVVIGMLVSGAALSDGLPPRPEAPAPIEGQCAQNLPISEGRPLPRMLSSQPGHALCSAVAVPLSDYADLLATEVWATAIAARYNVDTMLLIQERDWYRTQLEKETKPKPFLERPGTQRWFGRLETLVTVGVVAAGLGAAYKYGSGGFK